MYDQDEHFHSGSHWGPKLWIYTPSHMQCKNDKTVFHITAKALPCGMQEIKSLTVVLVPATLKRTDCFWSQCSKSNLSNTNVCLQSQMNFVLLLETAPGESFLLRAFLLPTPVHAFHQSSSVVLFQGVAHTFMIQLLLLQNAICNHNKSIYWWNLTKMKPVNQLKHWGLCDWVDYFLFKDKDAYYSCNRC